MSTNGYRQEGGTEWRIKKLTSPRSGEPFPTHHVLERQCPLDNGRKLNTTSHPKTCGRSSASLGKLSRLPVELLQTILLKLDLQTLTTFRSVNHSARHGINYLPLYKEVVNYAADTLRALIALGLASYFTASQVFNALRSENCTLCGDFGGYIYLLGCQRCCLSCIHEATELLPLSYARAKIMYGVDDDALRQVPQFEAVAGFYSQRRQKALAQTTFVDQRAAYKVGMAIHGGTEEMDRYRSLQFAPNVAAVDSIASNILGRELMNDILTEELRDGHDQKSQDPRRFLAVRAFPSLDWSTKSLEWGLSCNECRSSLDFTYPGEKEDLRLFNRLYSKAGYLRHLENCEVSRKKWKAMTEKTARS